VVTTEVARNVLHTVAERLPDQEAAFVNRLDLRQGWGNIVWVHIHTPHARSPANHAVATNLVAAVQDVFGPERHRVEMIWESV
jgi:hypothetical protein